MKLDSSKTWTVMPVQPAEGYNVKPEFIRLPKPGGHCPWTGLSRSKMNELVLPSKANDFKPPVRSVSLRQRGHVKGVRLVFYDSLIEYLKSCEVGSSQETGVSPVGE